MTDPENEHIEVERETEIEFSESLIQEEVEVDDVIDDEEKDKASTDKYPKSDGLKYTSFEEIEYDLKRLSLERQIAWEELKAIKYELKQDLKPHGWYESAISYISRLGGIILLRKLFFRS